MKTTFDPNRTRWQFLFALDSVEMREEYSEIVGADGARGWGYVAREFTFDARALDDMVGRWDELVRRQSAGGNGYKPAIVGYQHKAFDYYAPVKEKIRAGSLYDVALVRVASDGIPAGLWGLIEWTPDALEHIQDGTWRELSPSTGPVFLQDGTRIDGDNLLEVSLVDRGFLDDIGTAKNFAPWNAIACRNCEPETMATPAAEEDVAEYQRNAGAFRSCVLRSRSAQPLTIHPRESAQAAAPAAEVEMTKEELEQILRERDARHEAELATLRAQVATAAAKPAPVAVETKEQATTEPTFEERMTRAARQGAEQTAENLVVTLRMRPANAGEYVRRTLAGEPTDDLVADVAAHTQRASTAAAPSTLAAPRVKTWEERCDAALRSHSGNVRAALAEVLQGLDINAPLPSHPIT